MTTLKTTNTETKTAHRELANASFAAHLADTLAGVSGPTKAPSTFR